MHICVCSRIVNEDKLRKEEGSGHKMSRNSEVCCRVHCVRAADLFAGYVSQMVTKQTTTAASGQMRSRGIYLRTSNCNTIYLGTTWPPSMFSFISEHYSTATCFLHSRLSRTWHCSVIFTARDHVLLPTGASVYKFSLHAIFHFSSTYVKHDAHIIRTCVQCPIILLAEAAR